MATVSTGTQTNAQDLPQPPNPRPKSAPLTSAYIGGRLRYANPEDLPSFPSLGLKKDDAAASAAASLGWANSRPVSLWIPEKDPSAQTAATLANDFKMPVAWQPDREPTGSKTAAMLAAGNASRPDARAPVPAASPWGNSAANQAFAASGGGGLIEPREPMGTLDRQKSLRAAKEAVAGTGRPRSTSSPLTYPDSANAAANALSAATAAHRPTVIHIRMEDAGAQPITTMGREMYTSKPPVKTEVEDKNREAVLHASAVAMAKRMYSYQQQAEAQQHGAGSRPGSSGRDAGQQPMQVANLQDAAYKLAQERLARLQDEHQRNRGVAEYYGTSPNIPSSPARRLTKLGTFRRRSSSDGAIVPSMPDNDKQRSNQIRSQMSLFSNRLDEVDQAKRTRDREALLAAAKRNVKATMDGMDEKMSRESGMVPPAKLGAWETKAHAAAQARSDARMAGDMSGKVDLGAGIYMDREKVDEIAAKRVQPVLDEINEKAELERQRIAALREEQEKKRLEAEAEKARIAEIKDTQRKLRGEEKHRQEELKQEAKIRKGEEKAAKAEEKRLAKAEKDRPTTDLRASLDGPAPGSPEKTSEENASHHKHRLHRPFTPKLQTKTAAPKDDPAAATSQDLSPESATDSPSTRVKNWLKSRLHKPRAKSLSGSNHPRSGAGDKSGAGTSGGGFIGGHALTGRHADGTGSMTSLAEAGRDSGARSASMHEVALAGRGPITALPLSGEAAGAAAANGGAGRAPSVSSDDDGGDHHNNDDDDDDGGRVARPRSTAPAAALDLAVITPPKAIADPAVITPRKSGSPSRDSKFIENIE